MVLVRMGDDETGELAAPFLDEAQVGQDDLGTGQPVVGEADAEVDQHPAVVQPVGVDVHANLADAAEGHELQHIRHQAAAPAAPVRASRLRS